jgi:hypothetical protein
MLTYFFGLRARVAAVKDDGTTAIKSRVVASTQTHSGVNSSRLLPSEVALRQQ